MPKPRFWCLVLSGYIPKKKLSFFLKFLGFGTGINDKKLLFFGFSTGTKGKLLIF